MTDKKILLCILDGWGLGDKNKNNAVHVAKKKNFDFLSKEFGSIKLFASENGVGLPVGQFGNSEVGHMNIGAGRVLLQDILRINDGFDSGDLRRNSDINTVIKKCKRIHLVGILSDGGVHGHLSHLFKLIEIFSKKDNQVLIHIILDGRDSSPLDGLKNMKLLLEKISTSSNLKVVSISGRFYAMDRDNRWDRVQLAYKAIIEGSAEKKNDQIEEIKRSYSSQITDEFFKPINFNNYNGVEEGDGFFITNYRADRVRELLTSFFDKDFLFFERNRVPIFYKPLSMVEYSRKLRKSIKPIFETLEVKNSLGEIISNNKLNQLRIAETEKYAHVTYFFNGGVEEKFIGEDRVVIPSPRVETYDKKPEMAAYEVAEILIENIKKNFYNLIVANFANADMVGHSGNMKATIEAIQVVDSCVGKIYQQCLRKDYTLILTSDHGNADRMFDNNKSEVCTTHSVNPVPFIICDKVKFKSQVGCLADIAPTILKMMNISKPKEMSGSILIK